MDTNLSKELCEDVFMYGNHVINITIEVVSEKFDPSDSHVWFLHEYEFNFDHFRKVTVTAWKKEEKPESLDNAEIYSEVYAALDTSQEVVEEKRTGLFRTKTETVTKGQKPIPVREHVNEAVDPVLSRLNEFYKFSRQNVDVEIDVTMGEIISETSWVDIEDKTDEITSSLDAQVNDL